MTLLITSNTQISLVKRQSGSLKKKLIDNLGINLYVFREVGLQRVPRHEEFDLCLYSFSFVPHDVCTCVVARLVSPLLISERRLLRGKLVPLNQL